MTVKNSEKRAPWPILTILIFGPHNVENNAHSIFVVVSDQTLVSICCISPDHAVAFARSLG